MPHVVELRQVTPLPLAVVRTRATIKDLAAKITGSPVWDFLRRHGIRSGGHNVVVYLDNETSGGSGLFTDRGTAIEIGADVLAPFAEAEGVVNSATPAGLVATTRHVGPYHLLGQAHTAIHRWCQASGREPTGINWELYGHHHDDPAKLETDVFYQLR